jgi:hypothetical protein
MITAEIKLHDEPKTNYTVTTYKAPPAYGTPERRQAIDAELLLCRLNDLRIGDVLRTKNGFTTVRIIGFRHEDIPGNYVTWYMGSPCVVHCVNEQPGTVNPNTLHYAVHEFDLSSHVKSGDRTTEETAAPVLTNDLLVC